MLLTSRAAMEFASFTSGRKALQALYTMTKLEPHQMSQLLSLALGELYFINAKRRKSWRNYDSELVRAVNSLSS